MLLNQDRDFGSDTCPLVGMRVEVRGREVPGMAMTTFEIPLETLRARRGGKWNHYPKDVLPAWVADMDFRVPEPVREAMQRLVDESDFGYPSRTGDDTLAAAFQERMRDRFGWEIDTARVR